MNNLWLIGIEPIETRYTKHWYEYLPKQLEQNCHFAVKCINAEIPKVDNSAGAFFNFAATMVYKSEQAALVAKEFSSGNVKDGDVFLFTDYWNPTAHNIRYMADLLGIKVKLVGICHAGAWDPADLLGQRFVNKNWAKNLEQSFDDLYDAKVFATEFSRYLYEKSFSKNRDTNFVTGFPMEYYDEILIPYWELETWPIKKDIVVFPHRKSPEKNLDLFLALKERMPEYEFVVAMDVCKTKDDYHNLLYSSKVAFSASLQETLGISMAESLRCGCEVIVPNRLSYAEMPYAMKYSGQIANKFGSEYTERELNSLESLIKTAMEQYSMERVRAQSEDIFSRYFNGNRFYNLINGLK